jgi:predicted nicotinamide N-methyase
MASPSFALLLVLCLFILPPHLQAFSIETRRSVLLPWHDTADGGGERSSGTEKDRHVIGWTEERRDTSAETLNVKVGWSSQDDNTTPSISLPFIEDPGSLASTLWPGSLAAAILLRSPTMQFALQGKSLLELGSGLGLTGLAASGSCEKIHLTDNDATILQALEQTISEHHDQASISVSNFDWRDAHQGNERYQCIIASDVAYYYHLLRPLMDTVQAHLETTNSLMMFFGQANRESQWTLHDNILHGCYNQRTDKHDDPWPGMTKTLLYRLEMGVWSDEESNRAAVEVDGVIPVAALIYQPDGAELPPLTVWDQVATPEDISHMSTSF